MTGAHARPRFAGLPPLQKHPFDSALIAEARIEGLTLVTPVRHCARRSSYPSPRDLARHAFTTDRARVAMGVW